MTNEIDGAIGVLVKRIDQLSAEILDTKKTVNSLCRMSGKSEMYSDLSMPNSGGMVAIKPSQFYGKTPMVAAREYLDMRGDGEATTVDDILEALRVGGFDFDAQGWSETMRLKNLSISLGKNSQMFHRLPNGMIGLTKWYPSIKAKKTYSRTANADNGSSENDDDLTIDDGADVTTEATTDADNAGSGELA